MKCALCNAQNVPVKKGWIFSGVCIDFQGKVCASCAMKTAAEMRARHEEAKKYESEEDILVGRMLRNKRVAQFKTFKDVSADTGIRIVDISRIESGAITPQDGEALEKLQIYYNTGVPSGR